MIGLVSTILSDNERLKNKVDVLLAQYQACNATRDHYDSVRWIMGSIFIGASLAALSMSFTDHITAVQVLFIAIFSIALLVIWIKYDDHVQPWIDTSLELAKKTENDLSDLGLNLRLHHLIRNEDEKQHKTRKGRNIRRYLVLVVVIAWAVRLMMLL